MNNTKIICTIGPVSDSYEMLSKMFMAGMNIARLNMSHGDHEFHLKVINSIHELNQKTKYPVGILLDTKGPEIRTGNSELDLRSGETIEVTIDKNKELNRDTLYVDYPDLINAMEVGNKLIIDNGLINLVVQDKRQNSMSCKIIDGGVIKGKRHVNLPGVQINLPAITEKDHDDILFGIENGIDFIALSFVRTAENIRELKKLLGDKINTVKIISKIESQEGVENLEEIVEESDGIMVARGDLGIEINIEDLPNLQRRISYQCCRSGKRLIVATHLLESMIENPLPTRAEVTDVANAVFEDADCIMLSGETTIGKYPIKSIDFLSKMARKTETYPSVRFAQKELISISQKQEIAISAVRLARKLECKGLLIITKSGDTAECVANCRIFGFNAYAFTNDPKTYRLMTIMRGIHPFLIEFKNPEQTIETAFGVLKKREIGNKGDQTVIISDVLVKTGRVASIQVRPID
ncbi:MAG: pyruvate kinase [Proteobacteria bacterium]|nr:pyruvate kinase [Pseudomonadota bacterium]